MSVIFHWIIFRKFGQPGWYSLIPFFDIYAMFMLGWDAPFFWAYMLCMASMVGAGCAAAPIPMLIAYGFGMLILFVMLTKLFKIIPRGKVWVILSIIFDVFLNLLGFAINWLSMFSPETLNSIMQTII